MTDEYTSFLNFLDNYKHGKWEGLIIAPVILGMIALVAGAITGIIFAFVYSWWLGTIVVVGIFVLIYLAFALAAWVDYGKVKNPNGKIKN